jgi:hypothetical protein
VIAEIEEALEKPPGSFKVSWLFDSTECKKHMTKVSKRRADPDSGWVAEAMSSMRKAGTKKAKLEEPVKTDKTQIAKVEDPAEASATENKTLEHIDELGTGVEIGEAAGQDLGEGVDTPWWRLPGYRDYEM